MNNYNFDELFDRKNTDSIRWNKYDHSVIPLWVADMDFKSPPCVVDALKKRIDHGIFGYSKEPDNFTSKISEYLKQQYDWDVDPSWIVIIPSVVSALYATANNCVNADEHILVPRPVYHHLRVAAEKSNRLFTEVGLEILHNRLTLTQNSIIKALKSISRLLFFCNPHNPGGTVYTRDELEKIVNIAYENDIIICSDEIHAGMIFTGKKHIPIASISNEAADRTITLMSLNKTFNFPGAGLAWMICKDNKLRHQVTKDIGTLIPETQIFGYISTLKAIEEGDEWRRALINYLESNKAFLQEEIAQMDGLKLYDIEASYLGWINCENLPTKDPHKLFLEHGVALQPGYMFNQDRHLRINFGVPKKLLKEALNRMKEAVNDV
jgi:cystathionine beta-lyase